MRGFDYFYPLQTNQTEISMNIEMKLLWEECGYDIEKYHDELIDRVLNVVIESSDSVKMVLDNNQRLVMRNITERFLCYNDS